MSAWPSNVGILAIELVCPKQFVSQSELEMFDKVPAGKYTIGLGQDKMGFCTDREDINSLCLTVVERLIRRQPFGYEKIGRLEVGTETILDKSKSVKTVLMQLFEESGNTDVEGIDTTNACYGGTAALFNALAWVESSAWDAKCSRARSMFHAANINTSMYQCNLFNRHPPCCRLGLTESSQLRALAGRLALVVAGDIAVYAQGSARPTGGAGAIAMLVGPNAPLVIERGARATHMRHVYDFYKPNLSSEYPTVDGKLSIQCYLSALDKCYQLYCKKVRDLGSLKSGAGDVAANVTLKHFDAILFHSPYCKLVQKSLARLLLNDFICSPESKSNEYPGLEQYRNAKLEDTYFDRDIEKVAMLLSKDIFETKTKPSLYLANQVGNMYTPSLYGGLVSWLISKSASEMAGKRLGLFSYGSGFASSMYSLRVTDECGPSSPLADLVQSLAHTKQTLALRTEYTPEDFSKIMEARERSHHLAPYQPTFDVGRLFPDVWFLDSVDDKHRRYYKKSSSPAESILVNSSAFNHK